MAVSRRQRPLGPLVALVTIPLGLVALLGSWGGSAGVGRSVEMLQKAAGPSAAAISQSDLVETMLKKSLADDVNQQEGKLFARALRKGGITLDPATLKAVAAEVTNAKHDASSLAIDSKLQDDVKLASSITMSHQMHKMHRNAARDTRAVSSESHGSVQHGEAKKLELAAKILAHEKKELLARPAAYKVQAHAASRPVVQAKRPAATHPKTMKEALKEGLERKDAKRLQLLEHPELAEAHKKSAKPSVEQAIYNSLKAKLNHEVDFKQRSLYKKELSQVLSMHPDLSKYLPAGDRVQASLKPRAAAVQQSLATKYPSSLRDTDKMSNVQLEHMLKNELDQHVNFALRNAEDRHGAVVGAKGIMDFGISAGGGKQPVAKAAGAARKEAQVQQLSNAELEAQLRNKLNSKVQTIEKAQLAESMSPRATSRAQDEAKEQVAAEDRTGLAGAKQAADETGVLTNVQLEARLRARLNSKTSAMEAAQAAAIAKGVTAAKGKKKVHAPAAEKPAATGLPSDVQLEAALRSQLNGKVQHMEKAMIKASIEGKALPKSVANAEGRESPAQVKRDKELKREYAEEAMLKKDLDQGVAAQEEKEDAADVSVEKAVVTAPVKAEKPVDMAELGRDLTGVKHTGQFGDEQVTVAVAGPGQAAAKGGKMSRMEIEAALRAQLNARVAQKEKEGKIV